MPALAAPRSCSSAGTRCTRNRPIGVSASAWRWPLCSRTQRHSNGLAHRQTTVTLDLPTSTDKAADPLPGRPRPGLRPGLEDDLLARQVLRQGATVDRALPPALVDQGQAAAVPDQEVHPVGAFGPKHQDRTPKHQDRTAERIEPQPLLRDRRKPVNPFAEVDRRGGDEHLEPSGGQDHPAALRPAEAAVAELRERLAGISHRK